MAGVNRTSQRGFTLLEVIVALTITAFVLGGLFSLAGGSKQLAWRSQDSLERTIAARAWINFAMLEDEYQQLAPVLEGDMYESVAGDPIEDPERKTQATTFLLQDFEIIDPQRDHIITGSRWQLLALPQ